MTKKTPMEELDERIARIMKKMERLSEKNPMFSCGKFPPKWKPPLTEQKIEAYEKKKKIRLPEDYRRFLSTALSGGTQPFYGFYGLETPKDEFEPIVEKTFPYTIENPLWIGELSEEEYDKFDEEEEKEDTTIWGFLLLCTEGCGMNSILVVNTEDPKTYGTVWFYDLCNDFGIAPIIDPKTKQPMHFLDWFEYWVDQTLALPDNEYFSYGELVDWKEE